MSRSLQINTSPADGGSARLVKDPVVSIWVNHKHVRFKDDDQTRGFCQRTTKEVRKKGAAITKWGPSLLRDSQRRLIPKRGNRKRK